MTRTVSELIENLQGYPGNLVISLKDVEEQEFSIISFTPGANTLTLVISEEEEEGETGE